jgi:hypothetical protein
MHHRQSEARQAPVEALSIQTDMTGIPARPEELQDIQGKQPDGSSKTRQIKLGCVFPQSRDAQGRPQREPFSSAYLAAFGHRTDVAPLLGSEALKRGYATVRKTLFIGDGPEWIWNLLNDRFKDAAQIVDFYQACERLLALCQALEPEELRPPTLFRSWRKRMKNNGLPRILLETAPRLSALSATNRKLVEAQLLYFPTNPARMTYRTFRRQGYFIGSGVIEGAGRLIVAQRTKLPGMRWLCSGAENGLAFRSLIKSHLFDPYGNHHRQAASTPCR